jgi:hypothetical protein
VAAPNGLKAGASHGKPQFTGPTMRIAAGDDSAAEATLLLGHVLTGRRKSAAGGCSEIPYGTSLSSCCRNCTGMAKLIPDAC